MPFRFPFLLSAAFCLALIGGGTAWAADPDTPLPHLPEATALDLLSPSLRAGLPGEWALEVGSFSTKATDPVRLDLSFTQTDWPQTFLTLYLTAHPQDIERLKPVFENSGLAQGMGAEALMIEGHDCREMAEQQMITCRVGAGLVQFSAGGIDDDAPKDPDRLREAFAQSPFALYEKLFTQGDGQ